MRSGRPKADAPCESYSGNLCSGFGARCICWTCGWDKYEHRSEVRMFLTPIHWKAADHA